MICCCMSSVCKEESFRIISDNMDQSRVRVGLQKRKSSVFSTIRSQVYDGDLLSSSNYNYFINHSVTERTVCYYLCHKSHYTLIN